MSEPDDRKPPISLEHHRVACRLHMKPFRDEWPKGWPLFAVRAFQEVMGTDSMGADLGRLGRIENPEAPLEPLIEQALDLKPACCRLSDAMLIECYLFSKIGCIRRCVRCHRRRIGVTIMTSNMGTIPHLCFWCLVTGTVPNQA